jgi:hypothetical protein
MKSREERLAIAEELVWRIDTVALLKVEEVRDIYARALAGEWDGIFDGEGGTSHFGRGFAAGAHRPA